MTKRRIRTKHVRAITAMHGVNFIALNTAFYNNKNLYELRIFLHSISCFNLAFFQSIVETLENLFSNRVDYI